jgi:hypothetical protein
MILSSDSKLIIINMLEKKQGMTVDEYELYLLLIAPNEIAPNEIAPNEIAPNKINKIEIKANEMSIPTQPKKVYPVLPDSEDEES